MHARADSSTSIVYAEVSNNTDMLAGKGRGFYAFRRAKTKDPRKDVMFTEAPLATNSRRRMASA